MRLKDSVIRKIIREELLKEAGVTGNEKFVMVTSPNGGEAAYGYSKGKIDSFIWEILGPHEVRLKRPKKDGKYPKTLVITPTNLYNVDWDKMVKTINKMEPLGWTRGDKLDPEWTWQGQEDKKPAQLASPKDTEESEIEWVDFTDEDIDDMTPEEMVGATAGSGPRSNKEFRQLRAKIIKKMEEDPAWKKHFQSTNPYWENDIKAQMKKNREDRKKAGWGRRGEKMNTVAPIDESASLTPSDVRNLLYDEIRNLKGSKL